MNIARQTLKYEEKGFSREKAEISALMENAIFAMGYLTLKNANLPDQQRMLYSLHNIATLLL
jgi:hypothetical protein